MTAEKPGFEAAALMALEEHYPDCVCAIAAGSVLRGEATEKSDIDMVVLYGDDFTDIHRFSAVVAGWPFEFFVHNAQAQDYFMDRDRQRGMCVMMDMIANGRILPENAPLALAQRAKAEKLIAAGPDPLTETEIEDRRYFITDTLDDLDTSKAALDMYGTLANLYNQLGDFYLRAQGKWSGHGKALGRILRREDAALAAEFEQAFTAAYGRDYAPVMALGEKILAPYGGRCFAGLKRAASGDWRSFGKETG
jgi:hypothetical protein|tara:strand:- start:6982 stop:7734 length:753 start_codon:yes stop_codon:yes gene_type:complete